MDELQENIRKLLPLKGKKVLWTGFDPETQAFTILFDDRSGLHISGTVEPVADVDEFIHTTLVENKLVAMQILALENLYPEKTPTPQEPVNEPGT